MSQELHKKPRYQIVYSKRSFPFSAWESIREKAHEKAEALRKVGYDVSVWEHVNGFSRKTDL